MRNLCRADLLNTLHVLEEESSSPVSSALKEAVAVRFGFQYKKPALKQAAEVSTGGITLDDDKVEASISLQPLTAKNRYWYINFAEQLAEENDQQEEDQSPLQVKPLKQKQTTLLPPLSIKSSGEWQNLFDISLKQAQKSTKMDIHKSIKHFSQSRPIDNLPKQINYGFNKTVCLVMERTEALRPAWNDMREIWQGVEKLVGEKNLIGYFLPSGIAGAFKALNERTPKQISQLETDTLIIYMGAFGALHSGEVSADWQQHLKQQQKSHQCQLYNVCPLEKSPLEKVHQLDTRTSEPQALNQLVQSIRNVWLIDDKQLRYLREETLGATLHTELLAFNHQNIVTDAQFLWHKQNAGIPSEADLDSVAAIVENATQRWQSSRSDIAVEMEQLLIQMNSRSEEPDLEDYPHIENLAAKSQQLHQSQYNRDLALTVLRSIIPELEVLAKRPALKEWDKVMRVAQEEARKSGLSLPLGDKGLQSTVKQSAFIRQQSNHLQLVPSTEGINPAQNLLSIGNQAYCEETNRVIENALPQLDRIHIRDQSLRYQLTSLRKPDWAERVWQDADGLYAAHEDGSEFQLHPAKTSNQSAQWQGAHNAWSWASDYGIDEYGLWAILSVKNVDFRLRWISAGTFLMGSPEDEEGRGSEETQHKVTLTKGYWLTETSVMQAQWQAVMGRNPSDPKKPELPVNNVSWNDCQVFVKKLKQLAPEFKPKLPTEAQWEYACRAGTATAYWWGNDFDKGKAINLLTMQQEDKLPQNLWGLRSMNGNVREWCNDFMGEYSSDEMENPEGAREGSQRVLRGGYWFDLARCLRSAFRFANSPDSRYRFIGLRLAGGLDPQASESDGALTADRRAKRKPVRRQSTIADKSKGLLH